MSPTSRAAHPVRHSRRRSLAWRGVSTGTGLAAAALTSRLVSLVWAKLGGPKAPVNPADRRIGWNQALAWGIAAGVGAGVARVVGLRGAALGWEGVTGTNPPGVKTD
jgi:hypothetical protein